MLQDQGYEKCKILNAKCKLLFFRVLFILDFAVTTDFAAILINSIDSLQINFEPSSSEGINFGVINEFYLKMGFANLLQNNQHFVNKIESAFPGSGHFIITFCILNF